MTDHTKKCYKHFHSLKENTFSAHCVTLSFAQMVKCRKSLTAVVKFQGIILRCVELETTGFKIL